MDRDPIIDVLLEIRFRRLDPVDRSKIILRSCNVVRSPGLIIPEENNLRSMGGIINAYDPLTG